MLLHFQDAAKVKTKKIAFEDQYYARDSRTLEQLKELSSRRRAVEESINGRRIVTEAIAREMAGGTTSRIQQDLQKLESYLPLLENLIQCVETAGYKGQFRQWTINLKIRWSSPLYSSSTFNIGGPKFFCIDDLRFELAMVLFLYGSLLRERAVEVLSFVDYVESASLYRKAAGVYTHLAEDVLPSLEVKLPIERPPEVLPSTALAMNLICLADAQAVTAWKAESKSTSGGLLAKLHYGVVQFIEDAVSTLKSTSDWNDISDKFKRFLSLCLLLHEARSQVYIAGELKRTEQLGLAVVVLRHARGKFEGKSPGDDSWKKVYKQEFEVLSQLLRKCEDENDFIWHQKLPLIHELPILEGKKIVAPIPYQSIVLDREFLFVM